MIVRSWALMLVRMMAAGAVFLLNSWAADPIQWTGPTADSMQDLSPVLSPLRQELKLPAVAAAVVHGDRIVAAGAVGERKIGSGVKVTLADKFHIGSCTKSVTALLAIDVIRNGTLSLGTRVGDVFPAWQLDDEKAGITLEELLQNRSGLPGKPDEKLWNRTFSKRSAPPATQRREFLQAVLAAPLQAPPGSEYIYSNLGFSLAGAMIEKRLGLPWEELVRTHIFLPLELQSAGFGPPSTNRTINQPWGHQVKGGKIEAIPPIDNPPAIAPAGRVHMSILDLASYAAFHLANFNGKVPQFKEYREKMYHPPEGSDYALGWIALTRTWAGGEVLTHSGSNTMFYTVIWIAPRKNFVFVVCTNIGDKEGNAIAGKCDGIVSTLIHEFLPE